MIVPREPARAGDIARHYDDLDPWYRGVWGEHLHHGLFETGREGHEDAVLRAIERVAEEAGIGRGDRVCDVGCGYGATARWLAARRGAEVVGLTLSPRQHEVAVERTPPGGPEFLLRDWLRNGFAPSSFDAVVAIESLEHMEDKERFFTEAARVLRPGGRLVVSAWLAAESPRPWEVRFLLEPICREGRLPSLGSLSEYRLLLESAGLELVREEDWSRAARRTWTLVALGLARSFARDPRTVRLLFDRGFPERVFLRTVLRLAIAFRTGAFRLGMLSGRKPTSSGRASSPGAPDGGGASRAGPPGHSSDTPPGP